MTGRYQGKNKGSVQFIGNVVVEVAVKAGYGKVCVGIRISEKGGYMLKNGSTFM